MLLFVGDLDVGLAREQIVWRKPGLRAAQMHTQADSESLLRVRLSASAAARAKVTREPEKDAETNADLPAANICLRLQATHKAAMNERPTLDWKLGD